MLALSSFLRHLLASLATLLIFIVGIPVALVSKKRGQRFSKLWSKIMLAIYGIRVTVLDENNGYYEPGGNLIVTLNQASLTEAYIGTYAHPVPCRVIVNIEYALLHLSGWFEVAMGGHVVIRQWPAQAKKAVGACTGALARKERNYWISVEGKRSPDGSLQPYKKGTAVIAIESQCTIVPMVFLGARERMLPGDWKVRPGQVTVILCKAVSTTGLTYDDRNYLLEKLQNIAREKLEQA